MTKTAMVLCAGYGTRLKEYTKDIPKPMLEINGRPLLEYTVRHLAQQGFEKIIINLHYLPEKIASYFGDGKEFGVRILYSHEKEALGTAGAVKRAEKWLKGEDRFLLLYGDIICNENYRNLVQIHMGNPGAIGTIIVHRRTKSNSIVKMDEKNAITSFIERPKKNQVPETAFWVNSGIYCLENDILETIPEDRFSDLPVDIFPGLIKQKQLYAHPLQSYRCAIDSPERYLQAVNDLRGKDIFNILPGSSDHAIQREVKDMEINNESGMNKLEAGE